MHRPEVAAAGGVPRLVSAARSDCTRRVDAVVVRSALFITSGLCMNGQTGLPSESVPFWVDHLDHPIFAVVGPDCSTLLDG